MKILLVPGPDATNEKQFHHTAAAAQLRAVPSGFLQTLLSEGGLPGLEELPLFSLSHPHTQKAITLSYGEIPVGDGKWLVFKLFASSRFCCLKGLMQTLENKTTVVEWGHLRFFFPFRGIQL